MDTLPTELIPAIAAGAPVVFLLCRRFVALLEDQHVKYDTMIASGISVLISSRQITWLKNHVTHRCGGPAREIIRIPNCEVYGIVRKMWYKNGELHREDGPAVVITLPATTGLPDSAGYFKGWFAEDCCDWPAEYWYAGERYTKTEFGLMMTARRMSKTMDKIIETMKLLEKKLRT